MLGQVWQSALPPKSTPQKKMAHPVVLLDFGIDLHWVWCGLSNTSIRTRWHFQKAGIRRRTASQSLSRSTRVNGVLGSFLSPPFTEELCRPACAGLASFLIPISLPHLRLTHSVRTHNPSTHLGTAEAAHKLLSWGHTGVCPVPPHAHTHTHAHKQKL